MKKPSSVIFMALCKTYGRGLNQFRFMCNAIAHHDGISSKEANAATAAIEGEIARLGGGTNQPMVTVLFKRGQLKNDDMCDPQTFNALRRFYIKFAIKLFFKGQ